MCCRLNYLVSLLVAYQVRCDRCRNRSPSTSDVVFKNLNLQIETQNGTVETCFKIDAGELGAPRGDADDKLLDNVITNKLGK